MENEYNQARKITKITVDWIFDLMIEIWDVLVKRYMDIKKVFNLAIDDCRKGTWSINYRGKFTSIISLLLIIYVFLWVPLSDFASWTSWHYHELKIHYTEYPEKKLSEIDNEINQFANDYSKAFGNDCEWFRGRDVDIAMWDKYKRLRRDSYPCASFTDKYQVKLFPLSISNYKEGDRVYTLDVLFGRIEYNESEANLYSTVRTKLWKIKDDPIWRIDKMENIQKTNIDS